MDGQHQRAPKPSAALNQPPDTNGFEYCFRLIELELIDRERRTVERRIRAARFSAVKSFDTFDFTAIPSLNKMLVLELVRSEYILRQENVIALGNSGTGRPMPRSPWGWRPARRGSPSPSPPRRRW
jgi:DNA replication protein DnaC